MAKPATKGDPMKRLLATLALTIAASSVSAADLITYDTDQTFDDVTFGLENAILDAGLVIDHVSHTGDMLERTKGDVGSDVTLFLNADVYSFCSAKVSREVMEADPMNIVFCPYTIFVMVRPDTPDVTTIGFRTFPEGAMKSVEALLDGISKSAIGLD
jgi:uncharacterized protein (DUF302 family)